VNSALVPAFVAAGGGSALLAGIWRYEAERMAAARADRVRLGARFPLADPAAAKAALHALSGLSERVELVVELVASSDGVRHALWVPKASQRTLQATLSGLLPGLRLAEAPSPEGSATVATGVFVPTPTVLLSENPEAAARTLLAGLASLARGEQVVVRWALLPGRAPALPARDDPTPTEREVGRAWRQKTASGGGFQVAGLVLVRAASVGRARNLAEHVASCLRSRRGPSGGLRLTRERSTGSLDTLPKTTRSSGWLNVAEVLGIVGWPLGEDLMIPGVEVALTRQVPAREGLARTGRPLFVAERQGQPRPVALSARAALRHVAVLGASGGGKSTMLAAGIVSHIAAGHGGVVLDPKGDLVSTVLDHADEGAERIVVLDPSAEVVPGLDLFAGGDPDLRAEVLTGIFRSLFKDAWGPRTDSYIRLGVRTLASVPGATLLDLPQLLLDSRARRRALSYLSDPLLVGQWQAFEGLSEAERMQHLQAPLGRVMSLITRPAVQAVFGPKPTLDLGRLLLGERGWLLVPLSSGVIGSASARIIGSALTYLVWSHIASRAAIPPQHRHPIFLFFDELQALTDQGIGLEELLEQARGYGASVTIATQALGRTTESVRHSLLANVGSLISFRSGADEAARIAKELPGLAARDVQSLPPYEVAARVASGEGSGSLVVTGRTQPLGPPTGNAERIRARSVQAYGRSREQVQAAIRERYGASVSDSEPLGKTGRQA
jgi:Helicase HerA, central domain/Type IV secretion-system coupling protein DNA-binding domain